MSLLNELNRRNVFRVAAAYGVVSWLLIQVTATLLPTFGAPDWVAKVLIVVIVMGFIPAIIVAWVYELTPDGLRRESDVTPEASIARDTGRKLDLITIIAVLAGIAFVGLTQFVTPAPEDTLVNAEQVAPGIVDASVAVLPFANVSGNQDNEYFSDGLTETLLHMLAQVPDLKVAARTSSFAFKGRQQDVREIANALSVAHVLEGSVQRAGNRVRITVQLIRANDGFHVWSESYDRTLSDIFRIQDEIAEVVSNALTSSLLGTDGQPAIAGVATESVDAYDAYLKALGLLAQGSYAAFAEAERELQRALVLDPGFREARLQLALTYLAQGDTGMLTLEAAWRRTQAVLDAVLADHPDDLEAQAIKLENDIRYRTHTSNRLAGVEAIPKLRSILNRAPSIQTARLTLARILWYANEFEEAREHFEILLENDPLNTELLYLYGYDLENQGFFDEALVAYTRIIEIEPGNPNGWIGIGDILRMKGDAVGFVTNYLHAAELDRQDSELLCAIAEYLYWFELVPEGDRYLHRAVAIAPQHPMTLATRVLQNLVKGNDDGAIAMARAMIVGDVENRHGAFQNTVARLVNASIANGEEESAYRFFEEHLPAINRPEQSDVPSKVSAAQSSMFPLWYAVLPREATVQKMRDWETSLLRLGTDPADRPYDQVVILAVRGDSEAAVAVVLEQLLAWPPARFPEWRAYFDRPVLEEIVADERVARELERYAANSAEVRDALETYLAKPGDD